MKLPFSLTKSIYFFIAVAIISSVFWFAGESVLDALKYHREAVSSGQIWRLVTGHFVHSNGWHLLLNLASLLMIGMLFSQHLSIAVWSAVFIISALAISLCYFIIAPQYNYYVGLSATLYGVIIIGALLDIKQQPFIAILILVVVTGRVIWQQFYGVVGPLAEIIEDRVAIESHLFGIITGYILGLFLLLMRENRIIITKN